MREVSIDSVGSIEHRGWVNPAPGRAAMLGDGDHVNVQGVMFTHSSTTTVLRGAYNLAFYGPIYDYNMARRQ